MSTLDILIIIVIGASILMGYRRGLILTLASTVSYIAAAIIAKSYYQSFTEWLLIKTPIGDVLGNMVSSNLALSGERTLQEGVFTNESSFKLFSWANEYLANSMVQDYALQTVEAIKDDIITKVTMMLTSILSIVLLFLIIRTLIVLAGYLLNQIFELPGLNSINKLAGLAVGGLRGVLLVAVLLILTLPSAMAAPEGKLAGFINSSVLIQYFFNNLLIHILNWFL